jgi:death-on-curing protein
MEVSKYDVETFKEMIVGIHNLIIDVSGGEKGVRDEGGLEHAIFSILSFGDKQKNAIKLATKTYLLFAKRHYFVDGNKRTAHIIAKVLLGLFGRLHLKIHYKDAVKFIVDIAYDKKTEKDIIKWIKDNSDKIAENMTIAKHLEDCDEDIGEMKKFMEENFGSSV